MPDDAHSTGNVRARLDSVIPVLCTSHIGRGYGPSFRSVCERMLPVNALRYVRLMSVLLPLPLMLLGAFLGEPPAPPTPPARLSETGLYSDIATKTVSRSNLMFSPQYPLWTDGAGKKRWIYIPPGRSIDARRPDDWVFPVGTKLWKQFSFGKRVETRLLEKTGKGVWRYATYAWNDDETDAVLVSDAGLPDHVEIAPGIRHSIPGTVDCKACHEGQGRDVVLGFTALQLSPDRDPNAPHADSVTPDMVNLQTLVDRKLLVHLPERFIHQPPVIAASSPQERAALGYLSANCGGCHNATDPLSSVGMFLRRSIESTPEAEAKELESVICHTSKYQIPDRGLDQCYRVYPGDPWRSAIVYRMSTRDPYRQMPPLGTKIVDKEAVDLITRWIVEDLVNKGGATHFAHH
jgi:hypothetical protein